MDRIRKGYPVKRTITILLALFLSGMILIVGNASKPKEPKSITTYSIQSVMYFPLVYNNHGFVFGGVEIENGDYSISTRIDIPLDLDVEFWALSRIDEVKEMRTCNWYYGIGCSIGEVYQLPWEPFESQKTYTISAQCDYHPFYTHVQYRDDKGNLSPVYTDDITIIGFPLYSAIPPLP